MGIVELLSVDGGGWPVTTRIEVITTVGGRRGSQGLTSASAEGQDIGCAPRNAELVLWAKAAQ